MQVLNHHQIQHKIKRLAIQIVERNYNEPELILAGINNNGLQFAQLVLNELIKFTDMPVTLTRVRLNPANPLASDVLFEMPLEDLQGKAIIIIDDVANTGRTLFYAIKPLLNILPKKIETAALVDRKHKAFPIVVSYYGISLRTTLQENIKVNLADENNLQAYLQ